jgi:hypothetical protein
MYACRGGSAATVDWLCSNTQVLAHETGGRKAVLLGNAANGASGPDQYAIPNCTDGHFDVVKLLVEKYKVYEAEIAAVSTPEGLAVCCKSYIHPAIIGGNIRCLLYLMEKLKVPVEYLAVGVNHLLFDIVVAASAERYCVGDHATPIETGVSVGSNRHGKVLGQRVAAPVPLGL